MAKPNFRMGRRGTPPGKINTYRGQVRQWRGRGDPTPPGPPPTFRILGKGGDYLTSANGVYINGRTS